MEESSLSIPFTQSRTQVNPTVFRSVLPFRLHEDDDESDLKSILI